MSALNNTSTISTQAQTNGVDLSANLNIEIVDPQFIISSIVLQFQRSTGGTFSNVGSARNLTIADPFLYLGTETLTDTSAVSGTEYQYRAQMTVTLDDFFPDNNV